LIHLQLPAQVPGSSFQWKFNVQTYQVSASGSTTGGDVSIYADSLTTVSGASLNGWYPGNQYQWVTSGATPPPLGTTTTRGFLVTLRYSGATPTSTIPINEVNTASTAAFALEFTVSEDKCPGTAALQTPTNGAPYPMLTKCPQYNMANKSCCRAEDEPNSDYTTPQFSTQGQYSSPGVITWRDSACARHYNLAKCGFYCHPKSADYYTKNMTSGRNELVVCANYCSTVFAACQEERLWNQYNYDGALAATPPKIRDLYASSESVNFCTQYFAGLVPGGSFLKIDNNGGKCFDAAKAASASSLFVSTLTVFMVLAALFV